MLICLSGWKGSGKDTAAAYLIEKYNAVRLALADPLKDRVAEEFGVDRASLDDPKLKEMPLLNMPVEPRDKFSRVISRFMAKEFRSADGMQPLSFVTETDEGMFCSDEGISSYKKVYWTPRALAILKGSTNRSVTSNYWTEQTFKKAEEILSNDPERLIVVTDVRYKSELAQFKERFGEKAVFVRINRHKESQSQDPSERDLDNEHFDYTIDNKYSLEELYQQLDSMRAYFGS